MTLINQAKCTAHGSSVTGKPHKFNNLNRYISDTPSAPRGPGSVQSKPETDSIELRWNAPESDGGAAITDYLVERREVTKKSWKQVRPNGLFVFGGKI